jgi:hypothetical protein
VVIYLVGDTRDILLILFKFDVLRKSIFAEHDNIITNYHSTLIAVLYFN